MLNKFIIILLILLSALYYSSQNQPKEIEKPTDNSQTKSSTRTTISPKSATVVESPQLLNQQEIEFLETVRQELGVKQNKEMTESITKIKSKFTSCMQLARFEYRFKNSIETYTTLQKEIYKKSNTACKTLKLKYKSLSMILFSRNKHHLLQNLITDSQTFFKSIDYKTFPKLTPEEKYEQANLAIKEFINSNNSYLLDTVKRTQYQSNFLVTNKSISELLGTSNIDYLQMVNSQALTLLSCQFENSNSCDKASIFMLSECFNDEQACDLSAPQWFNLAFTDAHLDDIDLIIEYYLVGD